MTVDTLNKNDETTEVSSSKKDTEKDSNVNKTENTEQPEVNIENISEVLGKHFEGMPKEIQDSLLPSIKKFVSDKMAKELLHIPKEYRSKDKFQELVTKALERDKFLAQQNSLPKTKENEDKEEENTPSDEMVEDLMEEIKREYPELETSDEGLKFAHKVEKRLRDYVDKSVGNVMMGLQAKDIETKIEHEKKWVTDQSDYPVYRDDILDLMKRSQYAISFIDAYDVIKSRVEKGKKIGEDGYAQKYKSDIEAKKKANLETSGRNIPVSTNQNPTSFKEADAIISRMIAEGKL